MMKGVWVSPSVRAVLRSRNSGSALLFAVFACMVAVLCVHVLTATVIFGERALSDEASGRDVLAATDECLARLCCTALGEWGQRPWTLLEVDDIQVTGRLVELEDSTEWILGADAREPLPAPLGMTSAFVERGRDGLDLPFAAVVTSYVRSGTARSIPWLLAYDVAVDAGSEVGAASGAADRPVVAAYVGRVEGAALVADGCTIEMLDRDWCLDDGWRSFLLERTSPGPRAWAVEGWPGEVVYVPRQAEVSVVADPVLVVAMGGATLDLRGLGDIWGVFIADEGSVLLDGTVVHGAVYATECVDVGVGGVVAFSERILRWACDRSLTRARLVPGSRVEGIEESI